MKYDNPLLWFTLVIAMLVFGIILGHVAAKDELEKRCMYDNRIQFSKHVYGCVLIDDVTTTDKFERKPHPLAKELQ